MRRVCKLTGFVAGVVLLALPAAAQTPEEKAQEKDHDALRALRALYEKAINEGELELLEPYLAKDFTGVMVTNDPVTDFKELKAYWAKLWEMIGEGGQYKVTLKPELSWIQGDIAVARGTTEDYVQDNNGNEYRFSSSWTAVLVKREGQWKIMRIQGSLDPLGNPFVMMFLKRAAQTAGIVTGVISILVGLVGGFLLGRRKAKQSSSTPSPAK